LRSRLVILAVLVLASTLGPASSVIASDAPVARASATCDDYSNQADAQRAADTRDADGDGIYCVIYSR